MTVPKGQAKVWSGRSLAAQSPAGHKGSYRENHEEYNSTSRGGRDILTTLAMGLPDIGKILRAWQLCGVVEDALLPLFSKGPHGQNSEINADETTSTWLGHSSYRLKRIFILLKFAEGVLQGRGLPL